MMFIIIIAVVVGAVLIYGWIKLVKAVFRPLENYLARKQARKAMTDNPYIEAHRLKQHNDRMYEEYLNWLNVQGGDIPFEKWRTLEEEKLEQVLKKG